MTLQTTFSKIAAVAATGTLAAGALTGVAYADATAPEASTVEVPAYDIPDAEAPAGVTSDIEAEEQVREFTALNPHKLFKGKVTARSGLLIRSAPNTHSRILGANPYGAKVYIKCKVNGEEVKGNPRWYRLASGGWAWSSARYIKNIGPVPDWCKKESHSGSGYSGSDSSGHGSHGSPSGDSHSSDGYSSDSPSSDSHSSGNHSASGPSSDSHSSSGQSSDHSDTSDSSDGHTYGDHGSRDALVTDLDLGGL